MGEEKGLALFRDIVAKNGISVRNGHSLLANLVASGEVPLALNAYRHFVLPAKRAGAPIGEWYLPPAMAVPSGGAVARQAPHPYAAVLFLDFLLTDGQRILAEHDAVPTNLHYQHLPADLKLTFLDVGRYVDEGEKWRKLYKDIVTRGK
jgi:iron(III) transport system substrate-binding protein